MPFPYEKRRSERESDLAKLDAGLTDEQRRRSEAARADLLQIGDARNLSPAAYAHAKRLFEESTRGR